MPFAKCSPGAGRQEASVTRIAQLFNLVDPLLCIWLAIRHAAVDEKKMGAGFQDTRHLTNESVPVAEMMRRDSTADEVKGSVGIGQFFGLVQTGCDGKSALRRQFARVVEHRLRNVRGSHGKPAAGQVNRRVTSARGDVQRSGAWRRFDSGER